MSSHRLLAFRRRDDERPFVLGHRGARHAAPENTMAAFELAAQEGADGIELDVRLNGSGDVIVFHDPTLTRLTKGRDFRHIEDVSSQELARIDIGGGEHAPLLDRVLDWAIEHKQRVNVEVKSDVRRPLALLQNVVRTLEHRALPDVILSSFSPAFVFFLARRLPELPVAWLVHKEQRVLSRAPGFKLLGAHAVHPEFVLATRERVQKFKRQGAVVNVWTVNDPDTATTLAQAGVDAIISDAPGKILSALTAQNSAPQFVTTP